LSVHFVVFVLVMNLMPIASGLDIYSPLTVLFCCCRTCFWSGFDLEDVKLGLDVEMNCLNLFVTVVIVVDFYQTVVLMMFGLSVVVVGVVQQSEVEVVKIVALFDVTVGLLPLLEVILKISSGVP
jgi:hypothetical protein